MRIRGLHRSHILYRRVRNRFRRHAIVLMYHRVAEVQHDPWELCVSHRIFAEQMQVLAGRAEVVQLSQLFDRLAAKTDRPLVAITFDDGYADNLYAAKPFLDRYELPATVFLVSGAIGSDRAFWSDRLVRLVYEPDDLPERLEMRIGERDFLWSRPAGRSLEPCRRRELLLALWQAIRPLQAAEQFALLDALAEWSGGDGVPNPASLPMSREEILRMTSGGLVELGAHTVTHCDLQALTVSRQLEEMKSSKAECEKLAGSAVKCFAYPYGRFNDAAVSAAAQAGFDLACSTQPGVVVPGGRFRLPRIAAKNWGAEEFEARLRRSFEGE